MKEIKLTIIVLLLLVSSLKADIISFSGVVTSKYLFGDYVIIDGKPTASAAADIGSPVAGFVKFDKINGFFLVREAFISFPDSYGEIGVSQENGDFAGWFGLDLNGYSYGNDSLGASNMGFDNAFYMTFPLQGPGTFSTYSDFFEDPGDPNPDPKFNFAQDYFGTITAISFNAPDFGSTLPLFALALAAIFIRKQQQ
jgi:hypothetical protein